MHIYTRCVTIDKSVIPLGEIRGDSSSGRSREVVGGGHSILQTQRNRVRFGGQPRKSWSVSPVGLARRAMHWWFIARDACDFRAGVVLS